MGFRIPRFAKSPQDNVENRKFDELFLSLFTTHRIEGVSGSICCLDISFWAFPGASIQVSVTLNQRFYLLFLFLSPPFNILARESAGLPFIGPPNFFPPVNAFGTVM